VPTVRTFLTRALLVAVLAPALLLTGLRLVQPGAGWAVRAVSFAPYALPLYVVAVTALLAATFRAARDRAGVRTVAVRSGAAVVTIVLLSLHVTWVLPSFTGAVPEAASGTPRLRVMTHNVLHGGTAPRDVLAAVERADADVVVLQEVTRALWGRLRVQGLASSHPHAAGLAEDGHHDTVVVSRRPVGRGEPLRTVGDSLLVPVRLGERTVELLAVHARYPELPKAWREDHAAIAATARRERPALLAGDFNATYDHGTMRRYRGLGYRSAAELLNTGWQPTWPDHGHRRVLGVPLPRMVHIDHVMVDRHLTALTVEHLEVPGSDHRAVVAEVALR
jgi:endonuclease/exonuclease/phosphatase (EEP) superfamily protein YafD